MDDFKDLLEDLSEQEKQEVYKILNEYNNNGESKSLSALYDEDFEEIPVDIDTFLEDDMYCGQTTDNGKLIYPYWREQLRELFKDPNKYQEVAITGCLSGDTIIPLLNGDKVSIKELASRNKLDEYVYSFDVDTNKYVSGHLVDAFSTGIKDVYKITLDNGEFVVATSNHKFMLRNKNWKSIDSGLKVGDSLMPLYRGSVKCGNGYYESIKHPQKDGTFIVSIEYIGKEEVYDLTVERYHNFALESGIVAHNSIGTGKSTVACYGMTYLLYRTMCLRDPVRYYNLTGGSTIVFAFFNNTLDLVNAVGFKTVQEIVMKSPWFMERGKVSGTKYLEYLPNKPIRFRVGSTAGHALGTHIISSMLDEVSFKEGASVNMEQSKIMKTYNGVMERMTSRFMVNGKIAGKMFLVSSKNTEFSFLENYIKKQKGKPGVLVCDAKIWDVKPTGTYSGKKFLLAIGGVNKPSKIVPPEEVEYSITFDDGRKVTYKYNDVVKLTNGKEKKVQDLSVNDDILEQ